MELNVLWYYTIGFIIIWSLAILFRDKLKIEVEGPILIRRTQRLMNFIDSIAKLSPRFWRCIMNIGLPVAFFFMAFILYLLIETIPTTFSNPQIGLILPGIDIPGSPLFIPLVYGIASLMTVMVIHEFGHGIIARIEGVKIKSIGVIMLAVLPGAFVEPDEEDIEKSKKISRLRIYAAGSVFNLIFALLCLLIVIFISVMILHTVFIGFSGFTIPCTNHPIGFEVTGPIFPTFHEDGVRIASIVPNSPASGILTTLMVIKSINGVNIPNYNSSVTVLNNTKIGENVNIQTSAGNYTVTAGVHPNNSSRGYIGIRNDYHLVVNSDVGKAIGYQIPWFIYSINDLFWWIFLLNFAVGTFNLLPMKPLDGGLILEEFLGYKLSESKVRKIMTPLSYTLIITIAVIIIYGLGRGISLLI